MVLTKPTFMCLPRWVTDHVGPRRWGWPGYFACSHLEEDNDCNSREEGSACTYRHDKSGGSRIVTRGKHRGYRSGYWQGSQAVTIQSGSSTLAWQAGKFRGLPGPAA